MLKQTVSYTDFDENPSTETLYFNITKSELLDNLFLKEELESLHRRLEGDIRELTTDEVQEILNLVKTFMRIAYGIRSADGKRFAKNHDIWEEFTQTAVYDAFLSSLFQKPENAVNFLTGILPADLRAQAEAATKTGDVIELPTAAPVLEEESAKAPGEISDEDLLKMRPQDMTNEQLQRAFTLKNQK